MCVCPYISIGVGNMGKPLLPALFYSEFVNLLLSNVEIIKNILNSNKQFMRKINYSFIL